MKKSLLIVSLIGFIAVGCSKQEPVIDENAQTATSGATQTVNEGTAKVTDSAIEKIDAQSKDIATQLEEAQNSISNIYFRFDKYDLTEDQEQALKGNFGILQKINVDFRVRIEGNCDEWGTDEYNYALGLKRAQTVKDALIAEGLQEEIIELTSYGEGDPVCQENNRNCWAKNRRVHFTLLLP